jgi:hypothetical protein
MRMAPIYIRTHGQTFSSISPDLEADLSGPAFLCHMGLIRCVNREMVMKRLF